MALQLRLLPVASPTICKFNTSPNLVWVEMFFVEVTLQPLRDYESIMPVGAVLLVGKPCGNDAEQGVLVMLPPSLCGNGLDLCGQETPRFLPSLQEVLLL